MTMTILTLHCTRDSVVWIGVVGDTCTWLIRRALVVAELVIMFGVDP